MKRVTEVVEGALKDDDKLTPKDKEKTEINRTANNIKRIWNPDAVQNKASLSKRNECIYAIIQVAAENNLDHQQVADLIYGKGKVNVDSFLNSVLVFNLFKGNVLVRATPTTLVSGKCSIEQDGSYTLRLAKLYYGRTRDDSLSAIDDEIETFPVKSAPEASRRMQAMVKKIQKEEKEDK